MLKGLPLLLLGVSLASPQTGNGLPNRETLYYNVEWRLISAGKVKLQWQPGPVGWQSNVHVESVGLVSKLFANYARVFVHSQLGEVAISDYQAK